MTEVFDTGLQLAEHTCDHFLDGRIRAFQPRSGPRAAIDAIFLAASVPAQQGKELHVLEAGIGAGVASLALAARMPDIRITGVEIQPELCAFARENVRLNGFEDRIEVVECDLTSPHARLLEAGLQPDSCDHVMANPPFHPEGASRKSRNAAIATAYTAEEDTLEKWAGFLSAMAAPRASVTLIHRADAMAEVLEALHPRFGALTLFPLFPRIGEPARRIIVQGVKGSRAPLRMLEGLVLHEADGGYTADAERILRGGEALPFAAWTDR